MKAFVVAAALLLAPLAAHAACSATDFAIKDFKPVPAGSRMSLRGTLVNNCATAAAAQIRIDGKDETGKVLQTKQAWPAGTSNIAPGDSVNFDLGRMFRPDPLMTTFTVTVADVRAW
ncbi:hypothetical protein [Rhodanobacter sp. DHB23]|uniref:hypothetical protein n=1 Tax=Rhodanobacter sp. DHB23 TaxID=2775923 RepID=UPI0017814BBE|nr:hypothetical protein [Rhodanobacter sp. DHB23]MBD8871449.1 hypothetical protein [Rhodanobacter sp. DHB23]